MASYREFRNEKTYAAPDIQGLPNTLAALDTYNRVQAQRQQHRFDLQNNWKSYQVTNKIPSLSRKISSEVGRLSQSAVNAFGAGYQTLPSDIRMRQDQLTAFDKEAAAIEENIKRLENDIKERAAQDTYYRPSYDLEQLKQLTQDNDLPIEEELAQKNQMLASINQSIGKDLRQTFDRDKALADWFNQQGKTDTEVEFTDSSGVKSKKYVSARLRNANGVPEVTDEHIANAFDKDPRLYQSFQQDAVDRLATNWSEFKASGALRPAWTNGLTDQDIVAELANDTAKQREIGLAPKSMWQRVADEARPAIRRYEDTSVKSFYDQSKQNPGWQYGFTSDKINAPVPGFNSTGYSGPSWTVTTKSNASPYLTIDTIAKARVDPTTGNVSRSTTPRKTILNNISWGIYKTDDKGNKIPIPVQASDENELIEKIRQMPVEQRRHIAGVAPMANGYSIDKSSLLSAAYEKQQSLQDALEEDPTDPAAQASLEKIEELLDNINAGNDLDGQLIQKFMGTDIMKPEIFVLEPRDQNTTHIQSRTGADLFSDKSLTPEMRRFRDEVGKIISETRGVKLNYEPNAGTLKKQGRRPASSSVPTVTNQEEYDKLPSGSEYIGSDGQQYKKR